MSTIILALVLKYSLIYGIDPRVVLSVIQVESNYQTDAIGPFGEVGLMQLRPQYFPGYTKEDLTDPEINIRLGTKHLASSMERCTHKSGLTSVICYNLGVLGASKIKYPRNWPYYKKVTKVYSSLPQAAWEVEVR